MRILLVCISGITTNILAEKLQNYGIGQGYQDTFTASRVSSYENIVEHFDLVLLAPQARLYRETISRVTEEKGIPLVLLEEEEFALGDEPKIYQKIAGYRREQSKGLCIKYLDRDSLRRMEKQCLIEAVPVCVGIAALGIIMSIVIKGQWIAYMKLTSGLFSVYIAYSQGYQYGRTTESDPLSAGLLTISGLFLFFPVLKASEWNGYTIQGALSGGYLDITELGGWNILPVLLISFWTIFLLDICRRIRLKRRVKALLSTSMRVDSLIQFGVVFALLLLSRVIFSFFSLS